MRGIPPTAAKCHVRDLHGRSHGAQRSSVLTLRTAVYLERAKMTASFAISVIDVDEHGGRLQGADLEQVAQFLRVSGGLPVFDLEYDGRPLNRCRLGGDAAGESIHLWFDSISSLDSDPNTLRR
jgi:hypothetical protein